MRGRPSLSDTSQYDCFRVVSWTCRAAPRRNEQATLPAWLHGTRAGARCVPNRYMSWRTSIGRTNGTAPSPSSEQSTASSSCDGTPRCELNSAGHGGLASQCVQGEGRFGIRRQAEASSAMCGSGCPRVRCCAHCGKALASSCRLTVSHRLRSIPVAPAITKLPLGELHTRRTPIRPNRVTAALARDVHGRCPRLRASSRSAACPPCRRSAWPRP